MCSVSNNIKVEEYRGIFLDKIYLVGNARCVTMTEIGRSGVWKGWLGHG